MECERKTDATGCESLWLFGEHQRFGARIEQRGGSCVQGALGGHGVVEDQAHAGHVLANRGGGTEVGVLQPVDRRTHGIILNKGSSPLTKRWLR